MRCAPVPHSCLKKEFAMPASLVDKDDFDRLIARTGFPPLDDGQTEDMRQAYPYIQAMAARVRQPRDRGAEPAVVFNPLSAAGADVDAGGR